MPAAESRVHIETRRAKLAHSYHELFDEFSSKDLRTVGNYSLGRLIGKGSFGKVYLASHKLTNGSRVVLKSANKDDANLAREIHHHRQFRHPHIARLYEVIVTENLVWLVLEYCPGDELYNHLLRHGAIPVHKVQRIFAQLLGAVAYVHNMSCVHRDLKLENILLDKDENVKLVDFGFTREYEGNLNYLQTFCGTICYSAPEMLKGEKYAGEKVDVWSLGIILFALLTGELPFDDDDDMVTKRKVLYEEPKYPESVSQDAISLMSQMLSKRPLHRPTIAEILTNPFLAEYTPQQQAALKLARPLPFATDLEKQTLERMRSAGVDTEAVKENVLGQRCDALAGWWALLIEKEERKEQRRERKRKERENEAKILRRLSATSGRLERIATPLKEVDEEGSSSPSRDILQPRGRRNRSSITTSQLILPDLPQLPEGSALDSPISVGVPSAVGKAAGGHRTVSPERHHTHLRAEEKRRSQGGTLQLLPTEIDPMATRISQLRRRQSSKRQNHLFSQLTSIKQWFKESARRAKSPVIVNSENNYNHDVHLREQQFPVSTSRSPKNVLPAQYVGTPDLILKREISTTADASYPHHAASTPKHRTSLSPAPITPRSSVRYSSGVGGLRGRKSTSSSISSIRSIHHLPSHSKASSTSSASTSVHSSAPFQRVSRSPHTTVKVLPSTPTTATFPSSVRVVRNRVQEYDESAQSSPSTGLVFAKRKKTPFRGPGLSTGANNGPGLSMRVRTSITGPTDDRIVPQSDRASGAVIEEENEDEFEEVDTFSPIAVDAEEIIWAGETLTEPDGWIKRKNMDERTRPNSHD